jgi:glyoxylase-like metal-dependent hydrolase (beta-lactamase superfamily II)
MQKEDLTMHKEFYKETEGIYRLKVPFYDIFTSVFLIEANGELILVDTATTESDVESYIIPALSAYGCSMADISKLVLSHRHSDHAGGLDTLLHHAPQLEVVTDIRRLADGILTYPLAGHTKDSIGVLDTRTGTLIACDGLQGDGVWKYRCYTEDRDAYIETLKRIEKDTLIENILFSHAYEPWNKESAFGRDEVRNCLMHCMGA